MNKEKQLKFEKLNLKEDKIYINARLRTNLWNSWAKQIIIFD